MTKKIIAVALAVLMLAVILPANAAIQATSVEIRGEVYDASLHAPNATGCAGIGCAASWNANNFAGFWYDLKDGLMSENMTILSISSRTIDKDKLLYNATVQAVQFKVNDEKTLNVENGLNSVLVKDAVVASDGSGNVTGGGYYAKVGWQAEEYVALNGKGNKLAKIVYEQDATAKKTLTIGDVWDLGDGYSLTAQSIDTSTSPRQAWLALSKDGVKLDDKIIVQGQVYTYTKGSLASETDVPVFVTYVDSVFAGATSDILQLKYTWVITTSVTEIKSGDKFGVMEVIDDGSNGEIRLRNTDSSVSLSQNSVVDLMGNMKFSVADSTDLRFYPMVEYEIVGEGGVVTPSGTPGVTAGVTPGATTPATNVTVTTPPVTETTTAAVTTAAVAATTKKTEPGFEAIFAIAGLLAVAFLVLRQRKY